MNQLTGEIFKMQDKMRVLLTSEGTYPFHQGGVSQWCDTLTKKTLGVDYTVYSVVMNPYVTQKFSLPANSELFRVPLWGTDDPGEFLPIPFSQVYRVKNITDGKAIKEQFVPLFSNLIEEIINPDKNPHKMAGDIVELYHYFMNYDYKVSFKSEIVWEVFKEIILRNVADSKMKLAQPNVFDLIQSLGWLYRFFVVMNTRIPEVQVSHSTAAGFCGIPCVIAKLDQGVPYLLTEHGVYLREQYLSLARRRYSSYLSTFLIRLVQSVVNLNYSLADCISPVCRYNTRWEREFGVPKKNIEVIYNGVEKELFYPKEDIGSVGPPTVVAIARIDPVKDLKTLMKAAAIVKDKVSDVKFIVYGSVSVQQYYEECLLLLKQMNLEDTFKFAGHTNDPPSAYRSGDIVALSSITEAFPYSVVEAMMSGKPVVATDVGGVREALGDGGIVVRPRHEGELAQAIISLLENRSLRLSMGREARERALNFFTIERMLESYLNTYVGLVTKSSKVGATTTALRQQLLLEKGYALVAIGRLQEAMEQFSLALKENPNSPAAPLILLERAAAYNALGKYEQAFAEIEKTEALINLAVKREIA